MALRVGPSVYTVNEDEAFSVNFPFATRVFTFAQYLQAVLDATNLPIDIAQLSLSFVDPRRMRPIDPRCIASFVRRQPPSFNQFSGLRPGDRVSILYHYHSRPSFMFGGVDNFYGVVRYIDYPTHPASIEPPVLETVSKTYTLHSPADGDPIEWLGDLLKLRCCVVTSFDEKSQKWSFFHVSCGAKYQRIAYAIHRATQYSPFILHVSVIPDPNQPNDDVDTRGFHVLKTLNGL